MGQSIPVSVSKFHSHLFLLFFFSISGAGLSVSDNESCHGSQDGGSMANSQIVELRRIPIADTHL